MPPLEAANSRRQAADGLADARSCGVLYANVNPTNLLVTRDDVIQIHEKARFDRGNPRMTCRRTWHRFLAE